VAGKAGRAIRTARKRGIDGDLGGGVLNFRKFTVYTFGGGGLGLMTNEQAEEEKEQRETEI